MEFEINTIEQKYVEIQFMLMDIGGVDYKS
jgi:hypothetical protein